MRPGQCRLPIAIFVIATAASCSDEPSCEVTLTCEGSPIDEVAADRSNQNPDDTPSPSGGAPNLGPTDTGGAGESNPSNGGNPSQGGNGNSPSLPTPDGGGGSTPTPSGGGSGMDAGGTATGGGGMTGNVGGTAGTPSSDAGAGGDIGVVIPVTRCTGPADCSTLAPVCDTALDRCVVCKLDDDSGCTETLPYCVGAGNDTARCVACESETDCDGATPLCSPQGACVACMAESDCAVFPSTPHCREDGECVACLDENDCSVATPVCDDTGECAGCDDSAQCAHLPDTAECDTTSGACVECVGNAECTEPTAPRCAANECTGCQAPTDCADMGDLAVCDSASGACVECVADSDCPSATAAACVNNACVPCTLDAQCGHLSAVCDVGAGECVQCTGVKDDLCVLGGEQYVCDSLDRSCAASVPANEVGSAGLCQTCLSDAHCSTGQVCVQTEYEGEAVPGWFCLYERGATGAPASCGIASRPYFDLVSQVTSIDGREELTVCGLRVSTCAALNDYSNTQCDPNGDVVNTCGELGMDDGLCRPYDTDNLCTMRCQGANDCPGSCNMNGDVTQWFCEF